MADCIVQATLGTLNASCKNLVLVAMDYLIFAGQQDNSVAMGAKWRWTGNNVD